MKKIFLLIGFIVLFANTQVFSQTVGLSYKSTIKDRTTNIRTVHNHNSYTFKFLYKNLIVDVGIESFKFTENAHITDDFWPNGTFYGYVADGNLNSLSYMTVGLGSSFLVLKYIRLNSGFTFGTALKKEVENRLRNENGDYIFSFNTEGKSNVNSLRVRLYQSIQFEKEIYSRTKVFVGYELSTAINTIVLEENYLMPNTELSDVWNAYLSFGLSYSFSKL